MGSTVSTYQTVTPVRPRRWLGLVALLILAAYIFGSVNASAENPAPVSTSTVCR